MGRVERTDLKELSMGKIFVVFKKDRTLSTTQRMAIKPISELTMERISHSLSDRVNKAIKDENSAKDFPDAPVRRLHCCCFGLVLILF